MKNNINDIEKAANVLIGAIKVFVKTLKGEEDLEEDKKESTSGSTPENPGGGQHPG